MPAKFDSVHALKGHRAAHPMVRMRLTPGGRNECQGHGRFLGSLALLFLIGLGVRNRFRMGSSNWLLADSLFDLGNDDLARIEVVLCGLVARRVAAAVREDIPYPITGADLRLDLMIGSDECLKLAPPTGVEFEQKGEYLVAVVVWAPSGVTEIC